MLREKWTAEVGQQAVLERAKTVLETGLEAIHVANNLAACCLCATNLKDTEDRSDRLICLVEEERTAFRLQPGYCS